MAGIYGLSNKGRYLEDFQEYFYLAAGITAADVGKAVEIDTSGEQKVKLATDGATIIGRLEVVEDRKQEGILVGTVSLKGFNYFPIKSGLTGVAAVGIGDTVVGAGAGEVKGANDGSVVTNDPRNNFVKILDLTNLRALVVY